jgi:hypothetical protein
MLIRQQQWVQSAQNEYIYFFFFCSQGCHMPGHLDITKGKDISQGQKLTGAQSPMAPGFWSGLLNFYL